MEEITTDRPLSLPGLVAELRCLLAEHKAGGAVVDERRRIRTALAMAEAMAGEAAGLYEVRYKRTKAGPWHTWAINTNRAAAERSVAVMRSWKKPAAQIQVNYLTRVDITKEFK